MHYPTNLVQRGHRIEWTHTLFYNPGGIVLSGSRKTVLTSLEYLYLRVPSCKTTLDAHLAFQSPSARSSSLTTRYRSARAWNVRVSSGNSTTCDSKSGTPTCHAQWFFAMHLVSSAGSFGCGWHIWTLCISTLTDFEWLMACTSPSTYGVTWYNECECSKCACMLWQCDVPHNAGGHKVRPRFEDNTAPPHKPHSMLCCNAGTHLQGRHSVVRMGRCVLQAVFVLPV